MRSPMNDQERIIEAEILGQGIQHKFDHQLVEMLTAHRKKETRVSDKLDRLTRYPQIAESQLYEMLISTDISGPEAESIAKELAESDYTKLTSKKDNISRTVNVLLPSEQDFRQRGKVERSPIGTVYYADSQYGSDSNSGTGSASGSAWKSINKFTGATRSAGDVLKCRNGRSIRYDLTTDMGFLSDGTYVNPLVVEMDYDDTWNDHVDTSGTATGTLVYGSKTISTSASLTGLISVGDMIYIDGDEIREYAYGVNAISTSTITLELPYLGNQVGAGHSIINMGSRPEWDDNNSTSVEVYISQDECWHFKGIRFISQATSHYSGFIRVSSDSFGFQMHDCRIDATDVYALSYERDGTDSSVITKTSIYDFKIGVYFGTYGSTSNPVRFKNCLFDGMNNTNSWGSYAVWIQTAAAAEFNECEFKETRSSVFRMYYPDTKITVRNCHITVSYGYVVIPNAYEGGFNLKMSDQNQVPGAYIEYNQVGGTSNDRKVMESSTSHLRTGGSATGIKVYPGTILSPTSGSYYSNLRILDEIPVYLAAGTYTITIYVAVDNTTRFQANPTAAEMYLSLDHLSDATYSFRTRAVSTEVATFEDDTDYHPLSVTVTTAQDGLAFLTLNYLKYKESGFSNEFFVDTKPVFS